MRTDDGNHVREAAVRKAGDALSAYADPGFDLRVVEDYQAATADLIADLLHAGRAEFDLFDPDDALASGRMLFEMEEGGRR